MLHDNFWDIPPLTFKQLPTLQEVLKACDRTLLMRAIATYAASSGGDEQSEVRIFSPQRVEGVLDTMELLPLVGNSLREGVLIPRESFTLCNRSGLVRHRVQAELVLREHLPCDRPMNVFVVAGSSTEDGKDLRTTDYSCTSWEEVLSYRVWLGGAWCSQERYLALASAFWTMACFGLTRSDGFDLDYRDRLARSIRVLNSRARSDARSRAGDLARRFKEGEVRRIRVSDAQKSGEFSTKHNRNKAGTQL